MVILCIAMIGGTTYIGFGLGQVLRNRHRFFLELNAFFEYLDSNIRFNQKKIKDIIVNYLAINQRLFIEKFLNEFYIYLDKVSVNNPYEITGYSLLKDAEREDVNQIMNRIGKLNLTSELIQIKSTLSILQKYSMSCESIKNKYSKVYLQIGFISGCMLVLIVI